MSSILTYTGIMFDPMAPERDRIDPRDIAHALSMLCRANGHFPHFYSVAQHCINCKNEAEARGYSPRVQLACLLHDASEAYLSDITRPIKPLLTAYLEAERVLQNAIYEKWFSPSLSEEELKLVSLVDDDVLYCEFLRLTGMRLSDTEPQMSSVPDLETRDFSAVENEYLQVFSMMTREEH